MIIYLLSVVDEQIVRAEVNLNYRGIEESGIYPPLASSAFSTTPMVRLLTLWLHLSGGALQTDQLTMSVTGMSTGYAAK